MGKKHRYYARLTHVSADGNCAAGWLPSKTNDDRCYRKCKKGKIRRQSACKKGRGFCAKTGSTPRNKCHRKTN